MANDYRKYTSSGTVPSGPTAVNTDAHPRRLDSGDGLPLDDLAAENDIIGCVTGQRLEQNRCPVSADLVGRNPHGGEGDRAVLCDRDVIEAGDRHLLRDGDTRGQQLMHCPDRHEVAGGYDCRHVDLLEELAHRRPTPGHCESPVGDVLRPGGEPEFGDGGREAGKPDSRYEELRRTADIADATMAPPDEVADHVGDRPPVVEPDPRPLEKVVG